MGRPHITHEARSPAPHAPLQLGPQSATTRVPSHDVWKDYQEGHEAQTRNMAGIEIHRTRKLVSTARSGASGFSKRTTRRNASTTSRCRPTGEPSRRTRNRGKRWFVDLSLSPQTERQRRAEQDARAITTAMITNHHHLNNQSTFNQR